MLIRILISVALAMTALTAGARGLDEKESGQVFRPYGEGLPLPWPFPWAKECPVQWASISGRYAMLDSMYQEEVDLKISIVTEGGLKFMRISRFNSSGAMISDGFTFLTPNQRSVRVYLRPMTRKHGPLWANIKLYHGSSRFSCEMASLVPILSLVEKQQDHTTETLYRLVRRPIRE